MSEHFPNRNTEEEDIKLNKIYLIIQQKQI